MLRTLARAMTGSAGPLVAMSLALISTTAGRAQVTVGATRNFTSAGVFASGGETYKITATGTVDLATPTRYQTDPNGTIVVAPPAGSDAYQFFQNSAHPIGTGPAVGQRKRVVSDSLLPYAPHGALVFGYAMTLAEFEARRYPPLYVAYTGPGTPVPPPTFNGASLVFGINVASTFSASGLYNVSAALANGGGVQWEARGLGSLPPVLPTLTRLTATGEFDIAANGGGYKTTPDGVITTAPASGTQARTFFTGSAGPVGEVPAVGQSKIIIPRHPMPNAPYGALVAGWSKTASPSNYGDFPGGFQFIGTSGTITAPEEGGFLFLAVNDFFITTTTDNSGAFQATVTAAAPEISAAIMLSAFGGGSTVTPGGFVEIYGSHLSNETSEWSEHFDNGVAPQTLADVKVMFGDRQAFLHYVSPGQVNCIVPDGLAPGDAYVTVWNGEQKSSAFRVTVAAKAPSLLAPPSFRAGARQYAVAVLQDGAFSGPAAIINGVRFRAVKVGERVVFYGIGFGQSDPPVAIGSIARGLTTLPNVEIKFGDVPAVIEYAGFAPDAVALYQFNVVVPPGVTGDVRINMIVGGAAVDQELWIRLE